MTTRQFVILFDKCNDAIFREVVPLLEMLFYHVEPRIEDSVILCKTSTPSTSLFHVKQVLYDHWDLVGDVAIKVIPDEPIESLSDDYGFVTADKYMDD